MSTPRERWSETWALLAAPAPEGRLEDLRTRYAEPHRHHHGLEHVLDCLAKASACREIQSSPGLVDLALWYHDAVYEPRRSDNEARSAELAVNALGGSLPPERVGIVRELILDTRLDGSPSSDDGAVVVDVDRSILGAEAGRFQEYSKAIRAEYSWVPWFLYRRRRAAVLRSFLDRPSIFTTRWFRDRYEAQARANLAAELAELSSRLG